MKRWTRKPEIMAVAVVACLLCGTVVQAKGPPKQAAYTIIPFMPPGSTSTGSYVEDLNDLGHAVGVEDVSEGVWRALHLDIASGNYTVLAGGHRAKGVNNLNQIVGWSGSMGVFWRSPTAAPVELPPLAGDLFSYPVHINDAGIVIGESVGADASVPVVWHAYIDGNGVLQVAGPVELTSPLTASDLLLRDINEVENGVAQVVGDAQSEGAVWTVELLPDGSLAVPNPPVLLGTLDLSDPTWSLGHGINQGSVVCGESDSLPFAAAPGEPMQPLSVPRDVIRGKASSINDFDAIVGCLAIRDRPFRNGPGHDYATLWVAGDRIDLSSQIPRDSGWGRLSEAVVINNSGVVGGVGQFDVSYRGYILIPAP